MIDSCGGGSGGGVRVGTSVAGSGKEEVMLTVVIGRHCRGVSDGWLHRLRQSGEVELVRVPLAVYLFHTSILVQIKKVN